MLGGAAGLVRVAEECAVADAGAVGVGGVGVAAAGGLEHASTVRAAGAQGTLMSARRETGMRARALLGNGVEAGRCQDDAKPRIEQRHRTQFGFGLAR